MDHILAKNKKSKDIDELTTEITISNKSVQLYKTKNLHVKDMVVVKEDLKAENGVIHIVDCIMFVQPSFQDERLDEKTKEQFPITSCCFQKKAEVDFVLVFTVVSAHRHLMCYPRSSFCPTKYKGTPSSRFFLFDFIFMERPF